MNYWEGRMDWALKQGWVCEICGEYVGLTWGLVHGTCRCNQCHTQYRMRVADKKQTVTDTPICQLKPEYYERWKELWKELHIPIEEVPEEKWELIKESK